MKPRGSSSPQVIGAVVAVLAVVVTVVIFSQAFRAPFASSTREVAATFERATQLTVGSQVRIDGNVEGEVTDISALPDRESARVRMKVKRSAGEIHADARAKVSFKTLLGGVHYVAIERGTSAAGPLGDKVIPARNTSVQAELEDLTDAIRAGAVDGLKTLPGELADALDDPRAPATALGVLAEVAPDTEVALRALRGTRPGTDVAELVDATATATAALDAPRDEMRTLVQSAAQTLEVTGRRSEEIRRTLEAGPDTTADMDRTFSRLDRTLALARGLVRRLRPAAPDVAPTLAQLRPTVVATADLLRAARPITRTLPRTLGTLRGASEHIVPLVDDLRPALGQIDGTILPYVAREDPDTGKSTTVMIGGWAANFGMAAGQQDENGHFVRFPASVGANTAYLPCRSSLLEGNASVIAECDGLEQALQQYFSYVPALGGLAGGTRRRP